MARRKQGKEVQTINFDCEVLKRLKELAQKEGTSVSSVVNFAMRKIVMTDYEYYRHLARIHNSKFQEYKFLMDSSPDAPAKITVDKKFERLEKMEQ